MDIALELAILFNISHNISLCVLLSVCVYVYACSCLCVNGGMYRCMCTCKCVSVYLCVFVCLCLCVNGDVCVVHSVVLLGTTLWRGIASFHWLSGEEGSEVLGFGSYMPQSCMYQLVAVLGGGNIFRGKGLVKESYISKCMPLKGILGTWPLPISPSLLPVHHKESNINPTFSLQAMEPTDNKTSEPKSPRNVSFTQADLS